MRDTDADWRFIAANEPFYGVVSGEEFKAANMNSAARTRFYASGEAEVQWIKSELEKLWDDFAPQTFLDFGCGVGRWLIPVAQTVKSATGVDVAPDMIKLARERADELGVTNVAFSPTIPAETFEWVNSYIVLQHIEPVRGYEFITRLIAATGRFISLHVTFYRTGAGFPVVCAYDGADIRIVGDIGVPVGTMAVYDYDTRQVMMSLFEGGFPNVFLRKTNHGGHVGAHIFARRD